MITIKINEVEYNIFTSWNEITLNHFCYISKAGELPFAERISTYTKIPLEIINQMKIAQLNLVGELVEFMEGFDSVNAFAIGYESDLIIGEQPYWKIEKCKQLLQDNKHAITASAEIVEMFTGNDDGEGGTKIGDKPVTEVIGMASFFLQNWESFSTDSKG